MVSSSTRFSATSVMYESGVTVTMGLPATRQVIGRVRDLGYRGVILVGGPHPTLIPESAFKLGGVYYRLHAVPAPCLSRAGCLGVQFQL
jgi:hypothetical protein